jgi:hypothetical protein
MLSVGTNDDVGLGLMVVVVLLLWLAMWSMSLLWLAMSCESTVPNRG